MTSNMLDGVKIPGSEHQLLRLVVQIDKSEAEVARPVSSIVCQEVVSPLVSAR